MKSKILEKIKTYAELVPMVAAYKEQGKKIVFAVGSFDITHLGHMVFFEQVKQQGDIAIIGVGSDKTIKTLKGEERPVYPEHVRVAFVASSMFVDYAVLLTEELKPNKDNHSELIALIKPDIYVLNNDDSAIESKREIIERHGGKLALVPRELPGGFDYISTTTIFEKIKKLLS